MNPNLNHPFQNKNHKSTQFFQMVPWNTPSPSYIDPWEVQQQRQLWRLSWTNNLSTWTFRNDSNVCKFLTHSIPTALVHKHRTRKNDQYTASHPELMTKNNNWKQSTFTRQSTSSKFHQEKLTLIKLEDFPSNQAVGTNTWWSSMHMTPTPFL